MPKPVFGGPFHGLVKGGELTLPNSETMSYPQPFSAQLGASGITQRAQGAGAAVPQRTPEQLAKDTANGHQWLDYAIVSGENGQLCGQELDENWHLYTDPAGVTWKLTARMYVASNLVRIRVRLINAYGRLPKRWEDVDIEILSADFSLPNGESDQSEYLTSPAYLRMAERNSDGSVLLFHLYWGAVNTDWDAFTLDGFPYRQQLRAVYKVSISGSGNYENQQLALGAGINAGAVLYQDLDDIHTDLSYDDTYNFDLPRFSCLIQNCGLTQSVTWFDRHDIDKWIVRWVFDSADAEVELAYQEEIHLVTTVYDRTVTNCGQPECTLEENYADTETVKFNLLRDGEVIAESGDYVRNYTIQKFDNPALNNSHWVITWRGLTLRDTTEPLFTLDELPGDHADGINLEQNIAFISPQIIGIAVKQAVRNGPGNFTLKRVHIGPAIAAEDDSSDIDQFAPGTNWHLSVFGSYEPAQTTIARATDAAVCYV